MYILVDATKPLRLKVALKKIILSFHKLLKQNHGNLWTPKIS
jgi:hypothetical protein